MIVAEPVTNKIILNVSPVYMEEILHLIREIDAEPAQVSIDVLIAEVDLKGTEEFGCEIGLQSPVLFQRSVYPAPGILGTPATTISTGLTAPYTSLTGTQSPVTNIGYAFNNTGPLGQNVSVSPATVGLQGLGNLGVGRVSPTTGVGGFVFSAASDSFSVLIRALQTQERIQIFSAPTIVTADNQAARILVGQNYPYVTGSVVSTATTGIPTVTNTVNYKDIGVQVQVVPEDRPGQHGHHAYRARGVQCDDLDCQHRQRCVRHGIQRANGGNHGDLPGRRDGGHRRHHHDSG